MISLKSLPIHELGPGIWCGIGIFTSFLWGYLVFDEKLTNAVYGVLAICLLVIGVYVISTSQSNVNVDVNSNQDSKIENISTQCDEEVSNLVSEKNEESGIQSVSQSDDKTLLWTKNISKTLKYVNYNYNDLMGYSFALLTGLFDGSLMVPFKLDILFTGHDDLEETYHYLASFGLNAMLICPVIYLSYIYYIKQGNIPWESIKVARVPGLLSGIMWASANFMSVHATYYLGIRIGFPLTQTCVIFNAVWGIFYFKEMTVTGNLLNFYSFLLGIVSIIIGSYFLAESG